MFLSSCITFIPSSKATLFMGSLSKHWGGCGKLLTHPQSVSYCPLLRVSTLVVFPWSVFTWSIIIFIACAQKTRPQISLSLTFKSCSFQVSYHPVKPSVTAHKSMQIGTSGHPSLYNVGNQSVSPDVLGECAPFPSPVSLSGATVLVLCCSNIMCKSI